MTSILAIDTSSDGCSAALYTYGKMFSRFDAEPRQHTRLIMEMVRQVLSESGLEKREIDGVAFGAGPGSFTGLRIAAGVAQGLAAGLDKPVIPVSTLLALASTTDIPFEKPSLVIPALDARMGEVYWGVYERQFNDGEIQVAPLQPDAVLPPEEVFGRLPERASKLIKQGYPLFGVGSGWTMADALLEDEKYSAEVIRPEAMVTAEVVARIGLKMFAEGRSGMPHTALPVYVRNEITWQKLPGR